MKHKHLDVVSTERFNTPYHADAAVMLLHINGKVTMEILKSFLCIKLRSQPALIVNV